MSESEFEQGPIRPPSESNSLFVRINRNCAWNQCAFCPVYKKESFSLRPIVDIFSDIAMLADCVRIIRAAEKDGPLLWERLYPLQMIHTHLSPLAFSNAYRWIQGKTGQLFLQDASVFSTPFNELGQILDEINRQLSPTEITAYAHAKDILTYTRDELKEIRALGLEQLHMGLESGHDKVLFYQDKGVTRDELVAAGRQCKEAGIALCVYVMPGLGGKSLSHENAIDTARAIQEIAPEIVRIRTLQCLPGTTLWERYESGDFDPLGQIDSVEEISVFVNHLEGVRTRLISDHSVNVLESIDGFLPDSLSAIQKTIDTFLHWPIEKKTAFIIGRRAGLVKHLDDLEKPKRKEKIDTLMEMWQVTPHNLDEISFEMLRHYIS